MSWPAQFVATMCEERDGGADFESAFALAKKRHKIEAAHCGGFPQSFEDDPEKWWKGVCWDAWVNAPARDGSRSRLHLLPGLMAGLGADESRSARKVGYRAAA